MSRQAVRIQPEKRARIADAFVAKLLSDRIEVIVVSLDGSHLHLLARFPAHDVRHWVGRAKKHSSHDMRQSGLRPDQGGLWAKRCHATPISDHAHQVNVFRYIQQHARRGAAVWTVPVRSHVIAQGVTSAAEA